MLNVFNAIQVVQNAPQILNALFAIQDSY